jgi:hypothetical protein
MPAGMMAQEALRFGVKLKKTFSKADRAAWTSQEKSIWKAQVQLGGEKKATKFMNKYFAKKSGSDEPAQPKPPKPEPAAKDVPKVREAEPAPAPGQLVCAGSLDWVTLGSSSAPAVAAERNLWGFHRIATPRQVKLVAGGPSARHFVAVDTGGGAWAWGRNCSGQLGLGDHEPRALPVRIVLGKQQPPQQPVQAAACGRHHTLLVAGGVVYSCGRNTCGQLGIGVLVRDGDAPLCCRAWHGIGWPLPASASHVPSCCRSPTLYGRGARAACLPVSTVRRARTHPRPPR